MQLTPIEYLKANNVASPFESGWNGPEAVTQYYLETGATAASNWMQYEQWIMQHYTPNFWNQFRNSPAGSIRLLPNGMIEIPDKLLGSNISKGMWDYGDLIGPVMLIAGPAYGIISGVIAAGGSVAAAIETAAIAGASDAALWESIASGYESAVATSAVQNAALAEVTGQVASGTLASIVGPETATAALASATQIASTMPLSELTKMVPQNSQNPVSSNKLLEFAQSKALSAGTSLLTNVATNAGGGAGTANYRNPLLTAPVLNAQNGVASFLPSAQGTDKLLMYGLLAVVAGIALKNQPRTRAKG